ncbi:exodeoxyribonuclease V subunit gamma [Chitinimonas lacunae]|uniref:RecBCD enzyme subunit RecC n=1 Tax=Chitinimonas lacunae TaxID=1963018 RepID=A0ABV8MTC6_9NEIS
MLHLYQSDRLEHLAELLSAVLAVPPSDPFCPETVIVQAKGMGRWLTLKLAQRFGVCANVEFPLPASFLWDLIETALGRQPRRGGFSPDALAWRIFHRLAATPPRGLAPYLAEGDERRRWRLARRIADIFDQYLVYRPDWLTDWERGQLLELGRDEHWQAELWCELAHDRSGPHRADLLNRLVARLNDPAPLPLPDRIVVFGVSSLPPALMTVLEALSGRLDVCLFALNPCREYWGDLADQATVARHAEEADSLFLNVGHPLLAAWGKHGRVFFDQLSNHDRLVNLFSDDEQLDESRLLTALQADILRLKTPDSPRPLADDDHSLQVHVCHSPLRQVEALKDALLARFDADPTLEPDDVVVLCPNIEIFAPYIDAVFGPREGEPAVPYAVADRGGLAALPLIAGWLDALRLGEREWSVERVLALLELPALARRFELDEHALEAIRDWTGRAGVRRGLSGDEYGWQAGLGRLWLGALAPAVSAGGALPLFADLYPTGDLDLAMGERVAALSAAVDALSGLAALLQTPRPLAEWAALLATSLGELFDPDTEEAVALDAVYRALTDLAELQRLSGIDAPIGFAPILDWLEEALQAPSGAGGFLTGGVTFAQLVPMRNLPFRVVAVLGLEDGAFPRERDLDGFDLIACHPRRGDRSRRLDERWLFLETLMAARDALLVFYTGRDPRSDNELLPSTVVSDLLDTVERCWVGSDGSSVRERIVRQHSLQPFSPQRFEAGSYAAPWLGAAQLVGLGDDKPPPFAATPLAAEAPSDIELADLLAFVRDPSRWFLRRLGIRFERAAPDLPNREPYALGRHEEKALLALAGDLADDAAALAQLGRASGHLPRGAIGRAWAARQAAQYAPLLAAWRPLAAQPRAPLAVDLALGRWSVNGRLPQVGSDGLAYRFDGKFDNSPREYALAWLRHLVLCAQAPEGIDRRTTVLAFDATVTFEPVDSAHHHLRDWLEIYYAAHRQPPPLFPKTSLAYAETLRRHADRPDAVALAEQEARKVWVGNDRSMGERDYDSVRAVWRGNEPFGETFHALAVQLFSPLVEAKRRSAVGEKEEQM